MSLINKIFQTIGNRSQKYITQNIHNKSKIVIHETKDLPDQGQLLEKHTQ